MNLFFSNSSVLRRVSRHSTLWRLLTILLGRLTVLLRGLAVWCWLTILLRGLAVWCWLTIMLRGLAILWGLSILWRLLSILWRLLTIRVRLSILLRLTIWGWLAVLHRRLPVSRLRGILAHRLAVTLRWILTLRRILAHRLSVATHLLRRILTNRLSYNET